MNYVFKIILNSAYGLSKEINGYLYDPLFTYSITVNGQLTILMLAEMLYKYIPDIMFYQMNTDGISIGYNPKYKERVEKICEWFCKTTNLELEHAFYKEMIIRDVNNYIGVYENGKTKKKGEFETETDYHKNPSFLVISKAIEQYFVFGKDYRDYIMNHNDVFDFLGGIKKKSGFDLNLYTLLNPKPALKFESQQEILDFLEKEGWVEMGVPNNWVKKEWLNNPNFDYYKGGNSKENIIRSYVKTPQYSTIIAEPQQKVTRFYVAKNGRKFAKEFHDGRKVGILKDWKVETAYIINEQTTKEIFENLDYSFYIKETEKVINSIEGDLQQGKLF